MEHTYHKTSSSVRRGPSNPSTMTTTTTTTSFRSSAMEPLPAGTTAAFELWSAQVLDLLSRPLPAHNGALPLTPTTTSSSDRILQRQSIIDIIEDALLVVEDELADSISTSA